MLRRLWLGVVKGVLIGGFVGSLVVFALGISLMSAFVGYPAAILTGICAALIAGKPIWARGAWIEVLLKSVAAAALGAGMFYAIRGYLDTTLSAGPLGQGALSQLPLVVLPLVATVLAVFFEVDNTDEPATEAREARAKPQRIAEESTETDGAAELEPASERATQRRASHKLQ